jgi:hypothetical protein
MKRVQSNRGCELSDRRNSDTEKHMNPFSQEVSMGLTDFQLIECNLLMENIPTERWNRSGPAFYMVSHIWLLHFTVRIYFPSKKKGLQNLRSTGSVPSWISHHMSFWLERRQNRVTSRLQKLIHGALVSRKSSRCSTEVLWSHAIETYVPAVTCDLTLKSLPRHVRWSESSTHYIARIYVSRRTEGQITCPETLMEK